MEINFKEIGYIRSPYKTLDEIPRQSVIKKEIGKICLNDEYKDGLYKVEKGRHLVVLFYFHKSNFKDLIITPRNSNEEKGVFLTRSPNRPNGIGMTIITVTDVKEDYIEFEGVDMLDNTPIIDIKPYSEGLNPEK